jgi:NADPH:quinone reductase-like Zn-dependent oxidoreductase
MNTGEVKAYLCPKIFKLYSTMRVTMKAATYENYGGPEVLRVTNIEKPMPRNREILIKIHATAATSGDCRLRKADPFAVRFFFGLFRPRLAVLGGVFSGQVEATGAEETRFKVGDLVFGSTTMRFGAYAEYLCLPEDGAIAPKPPAFSHPQAAALPFGGVTALHFLQKAHIQPGQQVLVYGASGAVGSAAVQIAKYFGAEVTAVCGPSNLEMVRTLGADQVLDYTKTDFSKSERRYDVVYEAVNKAPVAACAAVVKKGGILILGAAMATEMIQGKWAAATHGFQLVAGPVTPDAAAVQFLENMALDGRLQPVIDRQYRLEDIVEAHRYVEQGHKKGNVLVVVA